MSSKNLFVGVSKKDQEKMKDDMKAEMKQHKAEMKQKEKEQKAEEKSKAKDEKQKPKATPPIGRSPTGGSAPGSPVVPRPNVPGGFFGVHSSQGGCNDNAVMFVQHCITWLEEPGKDRMLEKGIYRLSGSHSTIQRLKQQFNSNPNAAIDESVEVHDITGVLKLYFREMPEPIVPFSMYDGFIAAAQEDQTKISTVQQLISLLPPNNKSIFTMLMVHLNVVAKAANLMDSKNLAIVFAPNIFRPQDDNPELVLADAAFAMELTADLISRPSVYINDGSKTSNANAGRQKSELDEQIEKFDSFVVANYITHYESQGYDKESAKKWALYYLQQQSPQPTPQQQQQSHQVTPPQTQQAYSQHQQTQNTYTYPHPQGSDHERSGSGGQSNPSSTPILVHAASSGPPQRELPTPAKRNTANQGGGPVVLPVQNSIPSLGSSPNLRPLPQPGSAGNSPKVSPRSSPRSSSVQSLPGVSGKSEEREGSYGGGSAPPKAIPPSLPPRPRGVPPPTPGPSPASSGGFDPPPGALLQPGSPQLPPSSPRPNEGSSSRPPRPAAPTPTAPNLNNKIQERLTQQQRARGMSISQMRTKLGSGGEVDYQEKMKAMMDAYRSGNVEVLQNIK